MQTEKKNVVAHCFVAKIFLAHFFFILIVFHYEKKEKKKWHETGEMDVVQ